MQRQRRQDDGSGDGGDPASGPPFSGILPQFPPFPSPSTTPTFSGIPTGSDTSSLNILPTSSLGSSPPASTPIWHFQTIKDTETCEPITIQWVLNNDDEDTPNSFNLDLKLEGDLPTPIELAKAQPFLEQVFTVNNASLPVGSYFVQGQDSVMGYIVTSNQFQVTTGPNTTCLGTSTTPSGPSSSATGTTTPIISGTKSNLKTAAIAGGTVGGLVGLSLIVLGAFWFLASRRNRHRSGARKRRAHGAWGGLDSVEYKPTSAVLAAGAGAGPRRSTSTSASVVKEAVRLAAASSSSSLGHEKPQRSLPGSPSSHEMARLPPPSSSSSAAITRGSLDSALVPDPFTPTGTNTLNKRSSRTARKPVPVYEPTPEELLVIARSQSESGVLRSDSSSTSSSSYPKVGSPLSAHLGSSSSTAPLSGDLHHAQAMLEGLKSKSSGHFAGSEEDGQLHYLIPDPPMSPRR